MCSRPITQDGNTFACRSCNECLAVRRHNWIARAMAEKATSPFSLVCALTYSDDTPENRDAAAMFFYRDIQNFLKRLRIAAKRAEEDRKSGIVPQIRFIVAGEQGDRNGRCHWHIVLYSNVNLLRVGRFVGLKNRKKVEVTKPEDIISPRVNGNTKNAKRIDWSLWPHGFSVFQEPDQGAMQYVLSYSLKDQFIEEKSRDTMREAKSENFATGLFRMSKRPSIGHEFLIRKMEALDASGSVLPKLQIRVPEMGGYWQPNGLHREALLWHLVALNNRARFQTGRDAPQWQALLSSCTDNEKDMEILSGEKSEEIQSDAEWQSEIELRTREIQHQRQLSEHRRRCGRAIPCDACLYHYDLNQPEVLATLGIEKNIEDGEWSPFKPFRRISGEPISRSGASRGINPYCRERGSKISRAAFPHSDPQGTRAPNL